MIQLLQLLVACAVGALLMYGFFRVRGGDNAEVKRLQAQLKAKTDELNTYKGDVQEHFLGTARAIDGLTRSYQTVFEQLEYGAYRLVGEGQFRKALDNRVALEHNAPRVVAIDETAVRAEAREPGPREGPRTAGQPG